MIFSIKHLGHDSFPSLQSFQMFYVYVFWYQILTETKTFKSVGGCIWIISHICIITFFFKSKIRICTLSNDLFTCRNLINYFTHTQSPQNTHTHCGYFVILPVSINETNYTEFAWIVLALTQFVKWVNKLYQKLLNGPSMFFHCHTIWSYSQQFVPFFMNSRAFWVTFWF